MFAFSGFKRLSWTSYEFFRYVHSQTFQSATEVMEIAGVERGKRSKRSNFNFVLGTVEQKPFGNLEMEQKRQII